MTRQTTTPPLLARPPGRDAPRARLAVALALAAAAASLSCRDKAAAPPDRAQPEAPAGASAGAPAGAPARTRGEPLRAEPTAFDLGSAPIRNPLNLYDIGIDGSPDHETVGTIDGVRVTTTDLEAHSVGAFSRIAERIYQARDDGYRWLIERAALARQAEAARTPLMPFLLAQFARLPAPTDADLERVLADVQLVDLPADERRFAATSLWRLAAWQARRDELVSAGRADMRFARERQRITDPRYARPDAVVARLDDRAITRADEVALAGYRALLARHEYWRIARLQFERYASRFLLEREAAHLGLAVDALERRERERMPAITDDEVRAFIADNPEYGRDPDGHERAADNVRRLRAADAERALDQRLRQAAEVRFLLDEPEFDRIPVEVPGPRWHGARDAEHTLVALHGLGCATCMRGSRLLLSVMRQYPGKLKVLAGDYFEAGQLGSYRGALALHCASPDRRDALLEALVTDFGAGQIRALSDAARAVGVDRERFRTCLVSDQLLPVIVENLAVSRRLGLERNVIGLFADGRRIGELKDAGSAVTQIRGAFLPPPDHP